MFHIGHLNILKQAKEQCEYLIAGVSTDELVRNYKHKTPIVPFHERIEIVRAIRYVDEAIPQSELSKLEAWHKMHFDVMFHGTDWKDSEIYNKISEELREVGVDIVFIKHTEGVSSTLLAEVLQKIHDEVLI